MALRGLNGPSGGFDPVVSFGRRISLPFLLVWLSFNCDRLKGQV